MKIWFENPLALCIDDTTDASGGIVVENSKIVELLASGGQPSGKVDQIFDASEHVIIPGLINTHHHFYQTLTRACPGALNKELFPWLKSLYPVWAGLTEEMIHVSTRLAAVELLLSGCTTAADHHYIFPEAAREALDIQVDAIQQVGIRTTLTRGSMSLGEDDGGLPPRNIIQGEDAILVDCERVIDKYHDEKEGAMIQIALAPCSPFSVTEDLMKQSAQLARAKNVRLHTHLAETDDETDFCIELFGVRPVDYLERVGWMADDVWLAHGIHFNDEEIIRLGKAGVGISHCPSSNMILGSGQCRSRDLENAGSPVGIGVDGSASNDCSNMIQEVRQALMLQRLRYGSSGITHFDALRWATQGSARCLGRNDIGEIAPGKQADLALFKLDETRFSGAGDPLAALLLCGAYKADYVMVAGKWKVEKGQLDGIDLPELLEEHDKAARMLMS
ncbi:MAG: 8-oxoguanine deaminase [Thermodesulfobacteriota bacterium]|nr:8-oxoguanine deaminase [Thermodesulfobacteriota bacterium]